MIPDFLCDHGGRGVEAVPFSLDLALGGCAASGSVERAASGTAE